MSKLKNETCILTYCKVFNERGIYIGKGYSLIRQNGSVVPVLEGPRGEELVEGYYEIRHGEVERLVVVCWAKQ